MFFELWTDTGFGDRILDLWSVAVIVRLLGQNQKCVCKWLHGSIYPESLDREYDTSLFNLPDTTWASHDQTPPVNKEDIFGPGNRVWGHYMQNTISRGIISDQIFPLNTFWGTTSLGRIYNGLSFYGLHKIEPKELIDAYFYVTKNTVPCQKLNDRINQSIHDAIGIHIRLSDKCVESPDAFTMTRNDYDAIKHQCKQLIAQQPTETTKFFVCSEDQNASNELKMYIRGLGKTVVEVDHGDLKQDEHAILDFFCLSRCKLIVQCTKYSTFSIAASLINRVPLLNFYGFENNALAIWKDTANIHIVSNQPSA